MISWGEIGSLIVWIGVIVIGGIKLIPGIKAAYEWATKGNEKKRAQPKLAISIEGNLKQRDRANDRIYHPFHLEAGEAMTWEQQALCSYDWQLAWRFTLNITNQTDIPAINIKLLPLEGLNLTFHIDPKIDYTKPFVPHKTESYIVICRQGYRCTGEEANERLVNLPFKKLRIEYTNLAETKFATEHFPLEDIDKKNVYIKI